MPCAGPKNGVRTTAGRESATHLSISVSATLDVGEDRLQERDRRRGGRGAVTMSVAVRRPVGSVWSGGLRLLSRDSTSDVLERREHGVQGARRSEMRVHGGRLERLALAVRRGLILAISDRARRRSIANLRRGEGAHIWADLEIGILEVGRVGVRHRLGGVRGAPRGWWESVDAGAELERRTPEEVCASARCIRTVVGRQLGARESRWREVVTLRPELERRASVELWVGGAVRGSRQPQRLAQLLERVRTRERGDTAQRTCE